MTTVVAAAGSFVVAYLMRYPRSGKPPVYVGAAHVRRTVAGPSTVARKFNGAVAIEPVYVALPVGVTDT